jgi:hypothetical protein
MMTDYLAQKSLRTLESVVRAQRLGLAQLERGGSGTERFAVRVAWSIPGRHGYANAIVLGVIRATRGG